MKSFLNHDEYFDEPESQIGSDKQRPLRKAASYFGWSVTDVYDLADERKAKYVYALSLTSCDKCCSEYWNNLSFFGGGYCDLDAAVAATMEKRCLWSEWKCKCGQRKKISAEYPWYEDYPLPPQVDK